jgi:hypothetical protein
MRRPEALTRRSEMKPPDQPSSVADATEDVEGTENEDEAVIVDAETKAGTEVEIAMTIRNTPALTAN